MGPNEGRTILLLRRHGHSMALIGEILDRSTSFIHRHVHAQAWILRAHVRDLRKLPAAFKLRTAWIRRRLMLKLHLGWLLFALGEKDEPP